MAIEPISASISILASVVSIAASVKQIMDARRLSKEQALAKYIEEAKEEEKKILQDINVQNSILGLMVISTNLLDQLKTEAQECENKHIQGRRGADTHGKAVADMQATSCMCGVLNSIKAFNQGNLPEGSLSDWWKSYNCQ